LISGIQLAASALMEDERAEKYSLALWTAILTTTAVAAALILPPIPQDPAYHKFADSRVFLGMPNVLDVLSNIPLVILGLIGIALCVQKGDADPVPGSGHLSP